MCRRISHPSETLRKKFEEKLNGDTEVTEPDRLRLKSGFAESENLFVILEAAQILINIPRTVEGLLRCARRFLFETIRDFRFKDDKFVSVKRHKRLRIFLEIMSFLLRCWMLFRRRNV